MATVNYSWNLPTVGGSEDTWGTSLNANWTDLDTLLGGVSQTEFAILDGATVTTAELNLLDGAVQHATAAWEAGTATEPGVPSPADVKAAIDALSYPTGSIIWHSGNTAPTGYLKANGAAVSRATYADLFAAIGTTFGAGDGSTTFALPDLRGEFIRGWDDGRSVDSGRVFGSAQDHALENHDHTMGTANAQSGVNRSVGQSVSAPNYGAGIDVRYTSNLTGSSFNTAAETRPRNVALLACIKF